MSLFDNVLHKINRFQAKHNSVAFCVAVIKKYSDDSAGKQAALLTYYSFLSLFPLLLVLTTAVDVVISRDPHLQTTIINGLTSYFPLLGNQLSKNVHRIHANGIALVSGILLTLYGARGVANVFRNGAQDIWMVAKNQRDNFPKSFYKSIFLIVVGGSGLILASIISGFDSHSGHNLAVHLLSAVVDIFLLFWLFNFLINFSLPKPITYKDIWTGAIAAAIGLVILQSLGGFILARELKKLDALYSYFAVTLGLLFWLYVQSQVLYYSIEISVVKSKKLWPRNLVSDSKEPNS